MNKTMTCIACPRGCLLDITQDNEDITVVGNQCNRGVDYALQELKESLRMLTTTVKTAFPGNPRLPVRLSEEVPLRLFPEYMKLINSFLLDQNCIPGDILMKNIQIDSGSIAVDLLATGALDSEVESNSTGEIINER